MLNTTRQYAIDITLVITLTCFHNPWNHRFYNVQAWQPLKMEHNIHTHITVNYTNTHENWAVSITLETQVSLTTHTFDICFLLFLFLFVTLFTIFSFHGHNRDNRMRCEHMFFWKKRNISMYVKICKLPNQVCCKV